MDDQPSGDRTYKSLRSSACRSKSSGRPIRVARANPATTIKSWNAAIACAGRPRRRRRL